MTHGNRESDNPVVSMKSPNNGPHLPGSAEGMERSGLVKGNSDEQRRLRTQGRASLTQALDRIRQAIHRDRKAKLTALWHHIYNMDTLREAFYGLNRHACPGVDEVTWHAYEANLEANLADLSGRLRRGAYRAPAVVRVYIPKPDGRQRPLGIPTLEDKLVQRAAVLVLNAVYEVEFLGFSYGFRPGRHPHRALDALWVALHKRKINWVYDADIQGYFDTIDHEWLLRFIAHRIGDKRVIRQIQKWLKAGVLEDGAWRDVDAGTPQGGSISPLLANIYLHYVLDLWVQHERQHGATGDVIIVRYADDFVLGFQHQAEAERFHRDLATRLERFGLKLHPTKTRLLEFGRFAARDRTRRGQGKPDTFTFLGFTHVCAQTRQGWFVVKRLTMAKRLRATLRRVKDGLRAMGSQPVPVVGAWLGSVVRGHFQYYAVPGNFRALRAFRQAVLMLWRQALRRRSQRGAATWSRLYRLAARWLPSPRILHPCPLARLHV